MGKKKKKGGGSPKKSQKSCSSTETPLVSPPTTPSLEEGKQVVSTQEEVKVDASGSCSQGGENNGGNSDKVKDAEAAAADVNEELTAVKFQELKQLEKEQESVAVSDIELEQEPPVSADPPPGTVIMGCPMTEIDSNLPQDSNELYEVDSQSPGVKFIDEHVLQQSESSFEAEPCSTSPTLKDITVTEQKEGVESSIPIPPPPPFPHDEEEEEEMSEQEDLVQTVPLSPHSNASHPRTFSSDEVWGDDEISEFLEEGKDCVII